MESGSADRAAPLRVLFLTPFPPRLDATHGGGRVAAAVISALGTRHLVGLLCVRAANDAGVDDSLRQRCTFVEEIDLERSVTRAERLWRRASPYLGTPQWAAYTWTSALHARLEAIADSWRPDVIHFEYHVMGQYATAAGADAAIRILTEYEPGTTAAGEHEAVRPDRSSWLSRAEQWVWPRFERRMLDRVDAIVTFTPRDRTAVLALGTTAPVVTIPFRLAPSTAPIEVPSASREAIVGHHFSGADHVVLFVGNFMHPPNVDAARRLAHRIFPVVRAAVPEATLIIVGERPPEDICALADANIRCTGRVPEVGSYFARATVVTAPLHVGGGMRVKVLEALSAGKALVATPLAVEGLAVVNGEHLQLAATDHDFADAIVALLRSPERRRVLERGARAWAVSQSQTTWIAEYEALYRSVADARMSRHGH